MIKTLKPQFIVAIDPDTDKSGVASLEVQTQALEASTLTFPQVIDYLRLLASRQYKPTIVIEASWITQNIWHLAKYETKQRAAAKGYDVGRNHEVGRKIAEYAQALELPTILHPPLRKCWQGTDRKITHQELAYFTGIKGRTNQEQRDAALLAWHFAGLPIRTKPI